MYNYVMNNKESYAKILYNTIFSSLLSLNLFQKYSSINDIIIKHNGTENLINYVNSEKNNKLIINIFNGIFDDGEEAKYITGDSYYTYIFVWSLYNDIVKNNYDIAVKFYLKSIELDNVDAYSKVGILYFKINKLEEAQKYLLLAVDNGMSMFYLGKLYYKIFNIITIHDNKMLKKSCIEPILIRENNQEILNGLLTNTKLTLNNNSNLNNQQSSNEISQNTPLTLNNHQTSNELFTNNQLSFNKLSLTIPYLNNISLEESFQTSISPQGLSGDLPQWLSGDLPQWLSGDLPKQPKNNIIKKSSIPNIPECFIMDELINNGKMYFYDLSIKYYLKAIDKNIDLAINDLKIILNLNKLCFYNYLNNIKMKSKLVKNTINNLKKDIKIIKYRNRLSYAQTANIISECIKCQKIDLVLDCNFNCCCQLCVDCYLVTRQCLKCNDVRYDDNLQILSRNLEKECIDDWNYVM